MTAPSATDRERGKPKEGRLGWKYPGESTRGSSTHVCTCVLFSVQDAVVMAATVYCRRRRRGKQQQNDDSQSPLSSLCVSPCNNIMSFVAGRATLLAVFGCARRRCTHFQCCCCLLILVK
ncbi:unnamed protein product [Pylaiella littoralis]